MIRCNTMYICNKTPQAMKTITITFRVDTDLLKAIDQLAETQHRKRSNLIQLALIEYVEREGRKGK